MPASSVVHAGERSDAATASAVELPSEGEPGCIVLVFNPEGETAMQALAVVQKVRVRDFAQRAPDRATRGPSEEARQNGTGQSAGDYANRACGCSGYGSRFGPSDDIDDGKR
jgi:hypothetical protein